METHHEVDGASPEGGSASPGSPSDPYGGASTVVYNTISGVGSVDPAGQVPTSPDTFRSVSFINQNQDVFSAGTHFYGPGVHAIARRGGMRELNKLIPVAFILILIGFLAIVYVWLHLIPLLQSSGDRLIDGQIRAALFVVFTTLLLYCYYQAIFTDPGTIPESPAWRHCASNSGEDIALYVIERKKDGELRHCKWCAKYKPDRTHHCRVLGRCVLKMDHHCPWIYNTVGFANHKYFLLLLVYTMCVLWLICGTFWETVRDTIETETHFLIMFLALYEETLATFIALVVTSFLGFHCWLIAMNMTTIEYCEKRGSASEHGSNFSSVMVDSGSSKFDRGIYGNICVALGSNPLLWLLPFQVAEGNGLIWIDEKSRLTVHLDPTKDVFRKQRAAGGAVENVGRGTVVQGTVVQGTVVEP